MFIIMVGCVLYLVLDAFDNNAGVFAAQPSEKRWNSHDDFESAELKEFYLCILCCWLDEQWEPR